MSELPRGWASARLDEVVEINPRQPDVLPAESDQVSFLPMAAVEAMTGRIDTSQLRLWSDVQKGYTRFQDGDVLFAKITPCMENGKIVVAHGLHNGIGAGSTEFHVLRPSSIVSATYLMYHLLQESFRKGARAKMKGTAGQLRVPATVLEEYVLPIAPQVEQARIIEAVDNYVTRLDETTSLLERVQRNLKRYRASVLKAAVEGRLVPTEAELARAEKRTYEPASVLLKRILTERRQRWEKEGRRGKYEEPEAPDTKNLPDLPEGWCWSTVAAVGDVTLGRQRAPQYLTGRFSKPYLRVANIKDDQIDFSDVEEMDFDSAHFAKYKLEPGDILVSEGQSPHLVGQSAIYRGGYESLCFQKTLHRWRSSPVGPTSEYAQVVFRAYVRNGVFMRLASITTNIAHLTLEKFEAAPFPLAPFAEQARIVVATSRALSIADALAKSVNVQVLRSMRLRQSILKWAFEGKLVDQDPNDEPASALLARIKSTKRKP